LKALTKSKKRQWVVLQCFKQPKEGEKHLNNLSKNLTEIMKTIVQGQGFNNFVTNDLFHNFNDNRSETDGSVV